MTKRKRESPSSPEVSSCTLCRHLPLGHDTSVSPSLSVPARQCKILTSNMEHVCSRIDCGGASWETLLDCCARISDFQWGVAIVGLFRRCSHVSHSWSTIVSTDVGATVLMKSRKPYCVPLGVAIAARFDRLNCSSQTASLIMIGTRRCCFDVCKRWQNVRRVITVYTISWRALTVNNSPKLPEGTAQRTPLS